MSDPIDDLEAMIADALSAAEAMGMLPEIQKAIQELIEAGLSPSEVARRLGVTRQTVHNAKKSSAIL